MKSYIVIGAGILGASTAYHLAKNGAAVTIIDRKHPGQATEAAAGIVCPWLTKRRNSEWYHLVTEGARYYPTLVGSLQEDGEAETGYKKVGAINIFGEGKESMLQRKFELALERREDTPEMGSITKLSREETHALFPLLADEYSALHIGGGARVNGRAMRDALIQAAEKHGAVRVHGQAQLTHEEDEQVGVIVNGKEVVADDVLVTGGAWAKQLLEPLGLSFQVTYQKAQIIHLQTNEFQTDDWPVVMPPFGQYFLTFGNGQIVVGATAEDGVNDTRVTAGGVYEVLNKAFKVAPGFSDCEYVETKVGFRPFTPDSLPVIGKVPGYANLYTANGLGASGLTSGPFVGKELAALVMDDVTTLHLSNYDVCKALR
ncbi:NAD(P)/FAD-dependent oxidoreductase [Pontibacillus salicampi]|uniref:NAD(P)/FAD-dependent oxidoreductase n=1 Tax=Pontibacillus salicampi TaxID=1449801 RepID=A0ABV6LQ08_9BACI